MKNKVKVVCAFYLLFISSHVFAKENSHPHNGSHANHVYGPVGVMGEHPHSKGDWMLTYAYNTMSMNDNLSGKDDVSTSEILTDFMVSPTSMTMQMHMFGLMYGVSEKFIIMAMMPYSLISMDHVTRMGTKFTTKSKGIGDLKLSGNYTVFERDKQRALINIDVSVPTGSIDERDGTPAGANQKLPYPMQLGSGTYDFIPGITYTKSINFWSWGAQAKAIIRTGENDNDYRLGNNFKFTTWAVRKINNHFNGSLRIEANSWGNIKGADPELNTAVVPTSRADFRGGKRVDLLFGVDFTKSNNRFGIEAGLPIYQNLDGPQLATDYRLSIVGQLIF
tara:strand:+ start:1632 stop:2636 length:1005 start_codon:yes stop_codon:yes gene_type:complete